MRVHAGMVQTASFSALRKPRGEPRGGGWSGLLNAGRIEIFDETAEDLMRHGAGNPLAGLAAG